MINNDILCKILSFLDPYNSSNVLKYINSNDYVYKYLFNRDYSFYGRYSYSKYFRVVSDINTLICNFIKCIKSPIVQDIHKTHGLLYNSLVSFMKCKCIKDYNIISHKCTLSYDLYQQKLKPLLPGFSVKYKTKDVLQFLKGCAFQILDT